MTAYYCVWIATEAWRNKREAITNNAAETDLGTALKRVCASPSEVRDDAGVLRTLVQDLFLPIMIEELRPLFMRWNACALTLDHDPATDFEFVKTFAPGNGQPADILLVSVDADAIGRMDAESLGVAIYKLMDHPGQTCEYSGGTPVLRGASLSADEDCYLIFFQGIARDPNLLRASEEAEIRQGTLPLVPRNHLPESGRLEPCAVRFTGSHVAENATIQLGRGQMAVIFGKNGAGKTVLLTAIERMLSVPFSRYSALEGSDLPAASVVLRVDDQWSAARQFALLLAHLAFQPLSDLSSKLRTTPNLSIRAWDAFQPFDPSVDAISVADLVVQPLDALQDAVAAMLAEILSRVAEDVEPLARYIVKSPYLVVSPGGRVELAADPLQADASVKEAAERFLRGDHRSGMSSVVYHVYLLAKAVLAGEATAPLPTLGVQLAQWVEGVTVHRESGWLDAGEELERHLRHDLPIPLAFAPGRQGPANLNSVAEQAVIELLTALVGAAEGEEHIFASRAELSRRVLELFQQEVTHLLPRFIREAGHLTLKITSPTLWHRQRIDGAFARDRDKAPLSLDTLPSGYATWMLAAMTFAGKRLLHASWSGLGILGEFVTSPQEQRIQVGHVSMTRRAAFEGADPDSITVERRENRLLYLLDEPEVHLHLIAQHDVVEAIRLLSHDSAGALVATHALPFIDAPAESAIVHTLVNREGEFSMSHGSGLKSLTGRADELGIAPSALAQLYRGILLVEGINDVEVVNRYGKIDLDRERVLILPMQGHRGAVNLAEAEFLHTLEIPLFVLLDHVRRTTLIDAIGNGATQGLRGEEGTLFALHQSLVKQRLSMQALPFAGIDIVTAIPDGDIANLLQARGVDSFAGWKHILNAADAAWKRNKTKFKQTFQAETGVQVDALLRDLRASARRGHSPHLEQILTAMLTDLSSPRSKTVGLQVLKPKV